MNGILTNMSRHVTNYYKNLLTLSNVLLTKECGLSTTWKVGGEDPITLNRADKIVKPVTMSTTWRNISAFIQPRWACQLHRNNVWNSWWYHNNYKVHRINGSREGCWTYNTEWKCYLAKSNGFTNWQHPNDHLAATGMWNYFRNTL